MGKDDLKAKAIGALRRLQSFRMSFADSSGIRTCPTFWTSYEEIYQVYKPIFFLVA